MSPADARIKSALGVWAGAAPLRSTAAMERIAIGFLLLAMYQSHVDLVVASHAGFFLAMLLLHLSMSKRLYQRWGDQSFETMASTDDASPIAFGLMVVTLLIVSQVVGLATTLLFGTSS